MGIGMAGLYLADIILLVAGPIALDKIGWKFFLVLIIPTALHIAFVYFMCPETKGRSLVSPPQQTHIPPSQISNLKSSPNPTTHPKRAENPKDKINDK